MVAQLCQDFNSNYEEVNKQLDKMGYNIGVRLIEDFFAKSSTQRCANFRETADTISKVRWVLGHSRCAGFFFYFTSSPCTSVDTRQVGFKMFLNITPTVTSWSADNKQFSLIFEENPFADFVELPDDGKAQDQLWYSNILCGVLRGALEMVRHPWILVLIWLSIYRCKCKWRPISCPTFCAEMTQRRCALL